MKSFNETTAYKKGAYGEMLIDRLLLKSGIMPYKPFKDASHPFDRLCASNDKKKLFVVEVKTKKKRNKYNDTGFNYSNYLDYKNIYDKYNIPVFIFFIDDHLGEIYGNYLHNIDIPVYDMIYKKEYPLIEKKGQKIIYFPLNLIKSFFVKKLPEIHKDILNSLSNTKYEYGGNNGTAKNV